ncbi:hypothetical protein [Kitasatospora aureofaciens]|uniref:hypothetical protein n=1 Tax=Kitasatospora aureofaciens TaxID=1894 RepID=UPI00131B2ACE|nr:hypothetical protein [Kitasatospora aureofaciens]
MNFFFRRQQPLSQPFPGVEGLERVRLAVAGARSRDGDVFDELIAALMEVGSTGHVLGELGTPLLRQCEEFGGLCGAGAEGRSRAGAPGVRGQVADLGGGVVLALGSESGVGVATHDEGGATAVWRASSGARPPVAKAQAGYRVRLARVRRVGFTEFGVGVHSGPSVGLPDGRMTSQVGRSAWPAWNPVKHRAEEAMRSGHRPPSFGQPPGGPVDPAERYGMRPGQQMLWHGVSGIMYQINRRMPIGISHHSTAPSAPRRR